jgi:hypothetical protein
MQISIIFISKLYLCVFINRYRMCLILVYVEIIDTTTLLVAAPTAAASVATDGRYYR